MHARSDAQISRSQLVKGCRALKNTWAGKEFQEQREAFRRYYDNTRVNL